MQRIFSYTCSIRHMLIAATGSGTSFRPPQDASHTTTAVRGAISNDHTSTDSLQASDALITAAFIDNTSIASRSLASDTDLIGVGSKRPGSQAGSEADSVASTSRLSGRPVAGWKGRMSSMLIRSSPAQPKPEKEAVKEILKAKKVSIFFCCLVFSSRASASSSWAYIRIAMMVAMRTHLRFVLCK